MRGEGKRRVKTDAEKIYVLCATKLGGLCCLSAHMHVMISCLGTSRDEIPGNKSAPATSDAHLASLALGQF